MAPNFRDCLNLMPCPTPVSHVKPSIALALSITRSTSNVHGVKQSKQYGFSVCTAGRPSYVTPTRVQPAVL